MTEETAGKVAAKGPEYYDEVYKRTLDGKEPLAEVWVSERNAKVVPLITGSVLDLGCGLGHVADLVDGRRYFGIDFSLEAVREARRRCRNRRATFAFGDFRALARVAHQIGEFDTVLLLEVLEHLDPDGLFAAVKIALACARRRIVVTVPRDMPGRAHVTPRWRASDLRAFLGEGARCALFGGDDDDRWWLAVKEVEE